MAYLDRAETKTPTDALSVLPVDLTPRAVIRRARGVPYVPPLRVIRATSGRGLLSAVTVQSGYLPGNPLLDNLFNRGLAALCLLFTAPMFLLIWGMLKLEGGPAFYAGKRLGKGGKPFDILKFRTLEVGAQKRLSSGTLPKRSRLETRLGSYLRKSRVDELPQLINILKGDMVFFGPRPVRPELVHIYRAESDGFEKRFLVRPGLVGLSQALLPHAASKRLRGRFNAMCCAAPVRYGFLMRFVALVGLSVLRRAFSAVAEAVRAALSPTGRFTFLRSGFARLRDVDAQIETRDGPQTGAVCAMSDEVLQIILTRPVQMGETRVVLSRKLRSGRLTRLDLAVRVERVESLGIGQPGFVAFATFAPRSAYQRYRLERYFLDQSVLPS